MKRALQYVNTARLWPNTLDWKNEMVESDGNEKWRDIVGFEGYYSVSNLGRVRRDAEGKNTYPGRILKPVNHSGGYSQVILVKDCARRLFLIHRLVASAFISIIPNGMEVNHKDSNKKNNNLSNLEIVTPSENQKHMVLSGVRVIRPNPLFGESHQNSKLTESDVRRIRELRLTTNLTQKEIGKMFQITQTAVGKICSRKAWPHIA